jgi:creatinine amidohydrolase
MMNQKKDTMTSIHLQELTWAEVEAYLQQDDRCLIPVGSTEQHGRFAPLGTDSYLAQALAEEGGQKSGVLVAPPIWFGWSPHHLVCPGTISIRAEILIEMLFDVFKSLAANGFEKFVVINGHRIVNIPWMQIACQRAQEELSIRTLLFDPAYMSKEIAGELGFGEIAHAEEIEISQMLHCFPDRVDLSLARDHPHPERNLYHIDPRNPQDTLCYVPATLADQQALLQTTGDTVGGRPEQASAAKGKQYHEHLVRRLVDVLNQLRQS